MSRAWRVRPRIAARQSVDSGNPFQWTCCERVLLDGKSSVSITRLGAFTTVAIVEKIRYARRHTTIVSRYSWTASMNKSIFQFGLCAGPAYLALADAIELAIRAGSVQAGDRLPPQRMLADFLGLHVNTVNRAFRETRQRGLTSGNRRHGTLVLASSL